MEEITTLTNLITTLKMSTITQPGHGDPGSVKDCWDFAYELLEDIEGKVNELKKKVKSADNHQRYISEVLNSGDGVYRP